MSLVPRILRRNRDERNAWREMNRLQRRMDRMFGDFFSEPTFYSEPTLFSPVNDFFPVQEELSFAPPCDVEETNSHYLLSFDLPGVKKEDMKIDLRDNQLTISGERKEETKGAVSRERYCGSFCRSFTLPANAKAEKIEANYQNGVLQVAIPKTEITVGKQIPIKEGKLLESKPEKAA